MPTEKLTKVQRYKARKLREKRRKQRRVLAQSALIAAALITLVLILILFTSAIEFTEERYIVSEGDTLWRLYTEYGDGADWETWLHEMLTVNGIGNDAALTAGDEIILLVVE